MISAHSGVQTTALCLTSCVTTASNKLGFTKRICVAIFYNMNIRLSSVLHMVNCCNMRGSRQTNERSVCRLLLFMFLRLHMQSIQCHDLSWLSVHPESLYRCPSFCRCPWSDVMPCIWTSLPCYIECVAAQACLIPNFESNDVIVIKEIWISHDPLLQQPETNQALPTSCQGVWIAKLPLSAS